MNGIFYIGATGLDAHQSAINAVANNITNINTPAYKRASVTFSELIGGSAAPRKASARAPDEASGVIAQPSIRNFTPGELHATGSAFDLAIHGDGFIPLVGSDHAQVLWRGGTLHVDSDGYLATETGSRLEAMISVPRDASNFAIAQDGVVTAAIAGSQEPLELGQIDMVRPADLSQLEPLGNASYRLTTSDVSLTQDKPGQEGMGMLAQGFTEGSNVQLSDELVNLMIYQRAYAANARLVQVGDELMAIANGLKR